EKPVSAPADGWARVPQLAVTARLDSLAARVVGAAAAEVYATGAHCTLLIKSAAGFTVETVPLCMDQELFAATVTVAGDLFVGGDLAFVSRRSAGVWTREYLGNTLCTLLA